MFTASADYRGKEVMQGRTVPRRWSDRTGIRHVDRALCEGAPLLPSSSCRTELLAAFTSLDIFSKSDKFIARVDHRMIEVTEGRTVTRWWSDRTRIQHADRALCAGASLRPSSSCRTEL